MTAQPYEPDKYAAAIAMFEKRVTETAIAAAPVLGLLPAAVITGVHCYLYLNFGPVASPLVGVGVEAVSIAIVATRIALPGKGLGHLVPKMDNAFYGYLATTLSLNFILNIAHGFTVGWSWDFAGLMLAELALGLLPVPVSWLVATRHAMAVVDADNDLKKADASLQQSLQETRDAKIREENRAHELTVLKLQLDANAAEKDKKRAERLQKLSKTSKKVSTPVQSFPKDIRKLTQDQKVILSKMTAEEIATAANVDPKTGGNWLKAFKKEGL